MNFLQFANLKNRTIFAETIRGNKVFDFWMKSGYVLHFWCLPHGFTNFELSIYFALVRILESQVLIVKSSCFLRRPQKLTKSSLQFDNYIKALTKYKRPKMIRDARQKCSLFLHFSQKKTVFLAGISFNFWPFVFH